MELRQIEFAVAVARYANFTRAARDQHVAQPALSSAIQRLEAEVGVRLFDRTSRSVVLTDAGGAFLARARRVLDEVGQLSTEMSHYAEGARGVLRVSWWYQADPQVVSLLRAFRTENPAVEASIVQWSTSRALEALRTGDLDIASVALPRGADLSGIDHQVVRTEPYVLAAARDHRLAGETGVRLADLGEEPFIVTRPGTGLRSCFELAFEGHDEPPHVVIETNELEAMMALVAAGLGSAVVPRSIAERATPPVSIVQLEDSPPFVLAVAWVRGTHTRIVERAIALLAQAESVDLGEATALS